MVHSGANGGQTNRNNNRNDSLIDKNGQGISKDDNNDTSHGNGDKNDVLTCLRRPRMMATLATSWAFPGFVFVVFALINLIAHYEGSTLALSPNFGHALVLVVESYHSTVFVGCLGGAQNGSSH
jgi:hypothetical protein